MNPTEMFQDVLGEGSFLVLQSYRFCCVLLVPRSSSASSGGISSHFNIHPPLGLRKERLDDVLELTHVNGVAAILIELLKSVT